MEDRLSSMTQKMLELQIKYLDLQKKSSDEIISLHDKLHRVLQTKEEISQKGNGRSSIVWGILVNNTFWPQIQNLIKVVKYEFLVITYFGFSVYISSQYWKKFEIPFNRRRGPIPDVIAAVIMQTFFLLFERRPNLWLSF